MHAIGFFSVVFSITFRLLVINIPSSVSHEQQMMPLITSSNESGTAVCTWQLHRLQHAMKPDIIRESSSFCLPHLLSKPQLGVEYCYNIWYGKTRMLWLPSGEKLLRISLLVSTDTQTWWMDRRTPREGICCFYAQHREAVTLLILCNRVIEFWFVVWGVTATHFPENCHKLVVLCLVTVSDFSYIWNIGSGTCRFC